MLKLRITKSISHFDFYCNPFSNTFTGIEGIEGLDDDDDDDYDENERQFGGAVRDAVKNFMSGTVKYITNTRLIPSMVSQSITSALRRPLQSFASSPSSSSSDSSSSQSSSGQADTSSQPLQQSASSSSPAISSPTASLASSPIASLAQLNSLLPLSSASNQIQQASEFIGNVFRTMRSNWARRNYEQQQELRKRLAQITKRLTGSRVLMGTLHRLTGREDRSALKTAESIAKPIFTGQGYPHFIPVPYMMHPY